MATKATVPGARDHSRQTGAGRWTAPGGLPRTLTNFIGREREIVAVTTLLRRDDVHLVTLTGPGGVGKTRLAVEMASTLSTEFDRIWFVPLAGAEDELTAAGAIGGVLGVPLDLGPGEPGSMSPTVPPGLLLLDNLEHLPGIGRLIESMLTASPGLTVCATSRSRLGVGGEFAYMVQPLGLAHPASDVEQIRGAEAIRLFEDRARAASSTFAVTARNARDVAAICRRLDGLPLAIEIVAAHAYAFPPSILRERLGDSLRLSGPETGGHAPRFSTMGESIAWSYDRLADRERDALAQLGVFAGPWTIEAALTVVRGPGLESHAAVMESIDHLVRHNLVQSPTMPDGVPAFVLLETIRQFAAARLAEHDAAEAAGQRLVDWVEARANACATSPFQSGGNQALAELDTHIADVLHVLERAHARGDEDRLLELCSQLSFLWTMQGRGQEGRIWLERAEAVGRATQANKLGPVLITFGGMLHMQGFEDRGWQKVREGLSLTSRDEQPMFWLLGLEILGLIALRQMRFDDAIMFQEQALTAMPDLPQSAWATCLESTLYGHLGNIAVAMGEIDRAAQLFGEAIDLQVGLGFARGTSHLMASHPVAGLGDVARARGDDVSALALYQEALAHARTFRDYRASVYALGGIAGALASGGDWQGAAILFGAAEALHRVRNIHWQLETLDRQRALGLPEPWYASESSFGCASRLHETLAGRRGTLRPIPDPVRAADLWREGASLTMEQATALALKARLPVARPAGGIHGLSARELDVLRLVAAGKTDAEIASVLFISRRTVSNHVRSILGKLDVTSRSAATACAVRNNII